MKLTGKCKKAFKIWYEENMNHTPIMLPYDSFMGCHNSIKYGVFVDFFGSVKIFLCVLTNIDEDEFSIRIDGYYMGMYETRKEARTVLIQRASQEHNNKLNIK